MVVITFLMFAGATTGVLLPVPALCAAWRDPAAGMSVTSGSTSCADVLARCCCCPSSWPWSMSGRASQDPARRSRGDDARRGRQQLLMGPVASLESIKHLGTNGGGFFGMNAAHPFENPDAADQSAAHPPSMLLIPAGMTYAFGSMLLRRKAGLALFAACMVMFVGF